MKRKGLRSNPESQVALTKAIKVGLDTKKTSLSSIRSLLSSKAIQDAMEDILETSNMTENQKIYLREVFFKRSPKKKAIKKAFGRDLGYQEEAIVTGMMNHPEVREFVNMVKLFYVQVSPIAAVSEVEVLLNPKTSQETKLAAANSIQKKAGIFEEAEGAKDLPVNLVINMPGSNPTQVNNEP